MNNITNFDFVGEQNTGPDCGVPGYDKDLQAPMDGIVITNIPASTYAGWFKANTPQIALMHFGGADILANMPVDGVIKAYSTLLAQLRLVNPNAVMLAAQHTPEGKDAILQLNADIAKWAMDNTTPQSPVVAVDLYTGILPSDLSDGVHLNLSGLAEGRRSLLRGAQTAQALARPEERTAPRAWLDPAMKKIQPDAAKSAGAVCFRSTASVVRYESSHALRSPQGVSIPRSDFGTTALIGLAGCADARWGSIDVSEMTAFVGLEGTFHITVIDHEEISTERNYSIELGDGRETTRFDAVPTFPAVSVFASGYADRHECCTSSRSRSRALGRLKKSSRSDRGRARPTKMVAFVLEVQSDDSIPAVDDAQQKIFSPSNQGLLQGRFAAFATSTEGARAFHGLTTGRLQPGSGRSPNLRIRRR
jgi:hypothetical protein